MTKRLWAALGILLLAAGCGSASDRDAAAREEGPIRMLYIGGLTGNLAANAAAQVQTLEAAFKEINDQGGVLDRELVLETEDDGLDPTRAVSLLQEHLTRDRPDIVWAGTTSAETLAMLPALTQAGVLATCECSSSPINDAEQWTSFIGGFTPSNASTIEPLVNRLVDQGYRSVAVLSGSDAAGQDWLNLFTAAVDEAGLELVATQTVDTSALDYSAAIDRLQGANPDVFVARAFGQPAARILQDRAKLGFDAVPMVGDATFSAVDLAALIDLSTVRNLEFVGFDVQEYRPLDELEPARRRLVEALTASGGVTQVLSYVSHVWDAAYSMANAINAAESLEVDAVRDAVFELGMQPNDNMTFQDMPGIDEDNLVRYVPLDAYAYLRPGPIVDGMIQQG